jgi:hypothetical protein
VSKLSFCSPNFFGLAIVLFHQAKKREERRV